MHSNNEQLLRGLRKKDLEDYDELFFSTTVAWFFCP